MADLWGGLFAYFLPTALTQKRSTLDTRSYEAPHGLAAACKSGLTTLHHSPSSHAPTSSSEMASHPPWPQDLCTYSFSSLTYSLPNVGMVVWLSPPHSSGSQLQYLQRPLAIWGIFLVRI